MSDLPDFSNAERRGGDATDALLERLRSARERDETNIDAQVRADERGVSALSRFLWLLSCATIVFAAIAGSIGSAIAAWVLMWCALIAQDRRNRRPR